MYQYRLYYLDKSGHISGPPDGFVCGDDNTAIERVKRMVDVEDVELWRMDPLVIRLESKHSR
jgi:hypothetical protein